MATIKKKVKKTKSATPTKVIIGPCRGSYMFLNELKYDKDDEKKEGSKKCNGTAIVRKKDKKMVKKIKIAIKKAAVSRFGSEVKMKSKKFIYPLRDADKEMENGDIAFTKDLVGCYFIKTTAYKLPGLVDQYNSPIEDREDREELLVSGYYYMFSITFKPFDKKSNGVRAELNNLMFKKEGPRLDGGMDAEEEFGDFAEDLEDEDDDEDE